MPPLPKSNEHRFHFKCGGPEMNVLRFTGTEGLNELFAYEIDLVVHRPPSGRARPDSEIDFDAIVGKPAGLQIIGPEADRYVQGIVSRFELLRIEHHFTVYRAYLVPPHAKLALRRGLRIFQGETTKQIIFKVLKEGGISAGSLDWKAKDGGARDYCVQYRETDLDYVLRLLEEEGIAMHFEHTESQLKTIFTDKNAAFPNIPGKVEVDFSSDTSMEAPREKIHELIFSKQIRTGKVSLRDYHFKKPSSKKPAGEATGDLTNLEFYDYPGEFLDDGLGNRLATARLTELEHDKEVGLGGSDNCRFAPGYRFKLGGTTFDLQHPRRALNGKEYLLVRVTHSGAQPFVINTAGGGPGWSYGNTFTLIPAKTEYAPPRVTPRPLAVGTHTAVVVGPKGEEIYTDKFGRVKVHFNWEREGKSSCWIRVSQNWAGQGFGGMFLPRIGQEVLISFISGDPDRPLVTGRVYNASQEVPGLTGGKYADDRTDSGPSGLPDNKTRSSIRTCSSPGGGGFNEIRFEDAAGEEQIYVHAQYDFDIEVEHNQTLLVKNDRTEKVENIQKQYVNNHRFLHVKNDSKHTATNITLEASKSITLKCGSSTIELKPTSITIKSVKVTSQATGLHVIKGALVKIN
ncbi:MAG: type VI secretion system tip protein VgrG [Myxococcales bacterium]|nr:type VI secretion system tip protein VgrG [Myxococcales bacterium]